MSYPDNNPELLPNGVPDSFDTPRKEESGVVLIPAESTKITLSEDEDMIIGMYSDILVKDGVTKAKEYLEGLPTPPTENVQDLLRVSQLLYLSAHRKRSVDTK